jgi:hypothetical protein
MAEKALKQVWKKRTMPDKAFFEGVLRRTGAEKASFE